VCRVKWVSAWGESSRELQPSFEERVEDLASPQNICHRQDRMVYEEEALVVELVNL
jgi:hypothetical protein